MFLTKNAHLYQRPKRQSTLTADEASAVSELSKNEEAATITSPGPDFQIEEDLDNGLDNNSDDNNRQNKDNKSVLQRIVLTRLPEILRMKSPTDTESVMPIAITESDLKQFRELKFNTYDKKRFLSLWMEMVDGSYNSNNTKNKLPIKSGMRTNATVHPPATTSVPAPSSTSNGTKVSFHNFITYFRLNNDNISKRLFDLINQSLTGKASLLEFLQFCNSYLIIDKDTTEEFCFRIISRRGNNFNAKYSIIDLQDMENFVTVRYSVIRNNSRSNSNNNSIAKGESSIANINDDVDEDIVIMTLPVIKKKALSIFTHIDNDGDGGIDINEFHEFCRENPVFMKFSHPLQNHLRKCIFGIDFWVVKSRKIKKSKAGGLDSLTLLSRINVESERYTLRHIRDPVIDKIDNPLKVPPYVPPGFVISPTPQGKFLRGNTKRTLPRGSTNASAASTNSNNSRPVMEKTMSIAAFASEINKQREIDEISALSGEFGRLESLFISDDPDDVLDEKATATKPPLNRGMTQSRPMSGITAASRQTSSASIGPGRLSRTASRMSLVRKDANKEETPREPTPEELIEDNDKRKFISWRGPFTITDIAQSTFEADFPEIVQKKLEKRLKRKKALEQARSAKNALNAKIYAKLMMTCSDFVYKRRGVRKAFLKWLNVVDMESKVVLIVAVKSISAAEVDASAASIQDEIMSHHDEGDVRSIATDDRTIQLLPKFKQFTREEITSSCTTPRTDVSDESGKKFFLHRKIMAANQAMARQREENAGSAYIKHYLDDIHTHDWDVHRLVKLNQMSQQWEEARFRK